MVLYRHQKQCVAQPSGSNGQETVVHNQTVNNNVNNNVTININGNVNLLTFPDDDTGNFDFAVDNITKQIMKKCVSSLNPEQGFNRFMGAILDNPLNRIVMKSSPNVNYSKVHVGNGKWKLVTDTDVFPTMTHHMTTAAKSKVQEYTRDLRSICERFEQFVDSINTNDETMDYQNTIQRLKLLVVNMTRELEQTEKSELLLNQ